MFNREKIKINFFPAKNKKAIVAVKNFKKEYKNHPIKNADVIVAVGGDGTILSALHNSMKFGKPIF